MLLTGLLLAFVGCLVRGVWGAIVLIAAGAFSYLFKENIPLSRLLSQESKLEIHDLPDRTLCNFSLGSRPPIRLKKVGFEVLPIQP